MVHRGTPEAVWGNKMRNGRQALMLQQGQSIVLLFCGDRKSGNVVSMPLPLLLEPCNQPHSVA
jgi:hypothetical protein